MPPTGVGLATTAQSVAVATTSLVVASASGSYFLTGEPTELRYAGAYSIKVTITDSNGAVVTSTAVTWTLSSSMLRCGACATEYRPVMPSRP